MRKYVATRYTILSIAWNCEWNGCQNRAYFGVKGTVTEMPDGTVRFEDIRGMPAGGAEDVLVFGEAVREVGVVSGFDPYRQENRKWMLNFTSQNGTYYSLRDMEEVK